MGKDKLRRFRENETFGCMVQPLFEDVFEKAHPLKGRWRTDFFKNDNPIILELGCGRGEYTVGLAKMFPERNFIGIDVKGARLWRGGRTVTDENMGNAAFLRTRIEFINSFFAEGEVDQIWITFHDPQLKKNRVKKRLTSPLFLKRYFAFLKDGGCVNLKTDCLHLHDYTREVIQANNLTEVVASDDIYNQPEKVAKEVTMLQTTYEGKYLAEGKAITFVSFMLDSKNGEFADIDFAPDQLL